MTIYARITEHLHSALDALEAAGQLPAGLARAAITLEPPRDLAAQFSDAAVEQDGVVRQRMSAAVAMRPADGVLMNPGVFLA